MISFFILDKDIDIVFFFGRIYDNWIDCKFRPFELGDTFFDDII